jgi:hypothetical protein
MIKKEKHRSLGINKKKQATDKRKLMLSEQREHSSRVKEMLEKEKN